MQPGKALEGIRVLEVAQWWFVPSAGAILADWGAEVIKIEHPETGDPQPGARQTPTRGASPRPWATQGGPRAI